MTRGDLLAPALSRVSLASIGDFFFVVARLMLLLVNLKPSVLVDRGYLGEVGGGPEAAASSPRDPCHESPTTTALLPCQEGGRRFPLEMLRGFPGRFRSLPGSPSLQRPPGQPMSPPHVPPRLPADYVAE